MTAQKNASEIRKQKWIQILRACEKSGQTIRAYCKENGIKEYNYYYWKRLLRDYVSENPMPRQEVPLEPALTDDRPPMAAPLADTITVRVGGDVVEIFVTQSQRR